VTNSEVDITPILNHSEILKKNFQKNFDKIQLIIYSSTMEKNPIEFIKEQVELDFDTHFKDINWDKFYDIIEESYLMDVKRMELLKDFDTWKEWKNK
jgi:hypothetical protein